jgi:ferrous iron transport protein B
LLFTLVFWITISGANIPSRWISALLIDTIYPALREGAANLGFSRSATGVGPRKS